MKLSLVSIILFSLLNTASASVSVFFSYAAPLPPREIILPAQEYVDCYTRNPIIYQGVIYRAQSFCEHHFVPTRAMWVSAPRGHHHYHHHYREWWV